VSEGLIGYLTMRLTRRLIQEGHALNKKIQYIIQYKRQVYSINENKKYNLYKTYQIVVRFPFTIQTF